jgi:hypothetical protein
MVLLAKRQVEHLAAVCSRIVKTARSDKRQAVHLGAAFSNRVQTAEFEQQWVELREEDSSNPHAQIVRLVLPQVELPVSVDKNSIRLSSLHQVPLQC